MVTAEQICGNLTIRLGTAADRDEIYSIRHAVYATELGQHAENSRKRLSDPLDEFNVYVVAELGDQLVGFVSITPPGHGRYSIDKYLSRDELPFACDDGLYEVRILTIDEQYRGSPAAGLLMYAAFRWIDSQGGTRVVAIGRWEVLSVYLKTGMEAVGRQIQCGSVTFELLTATVDAFRLRMQHFDRALKKLKATTDWKLDCPFLPEKKCVHGGRFFEAVGVNFDSLDRRRQIINADVLDAWFPPAPEVLETLHGHLDWIARTSPPTHCEGMIAAIAQARGIPAECVVPAAGSSNLIFTALREWLAAESRVLILDPTYGEYTFVLENLIGCQVDRISLRRDNDYDVDLDDLVRRLGDDYDLVVLVNPNSPTGRHVPRADLEGILRMAPADTRFWIDETYVDFVSSNQSLEKFAARSDNVVVCKSMSKAYALSGLRAAYLCAPRGLAEQLRRVTPPWSVSLPAQIAAVKALENSEYYQRRWDETSALRNDLTRGLRELELDVVEGVANFVLCHLPEDGPDTESVVDACRERGVFLRDVRQMSSELAPNMFRVAVKGARENQRIVDTIAAVLNRGTAAEHGVATVLEV